MSEYYVHPSSVVDEGVTIGEGTRIWHFCHIQKGALIGRHCSLGQNVNVSNNVRIGDGCKLQNNVFTNDLTPRAKYPKGAAGYKKTLIREGASIGANATIVCGHTVGRWALIGAGAVVTDNVPDHALMLGVPARRCGWACECGELLKNGLNCPKCGRKYREGENGLTEVKD